MTKMTNSQYTIQYAREQIQHWQNIMSELNPYSKLPMMSNKEFGETWSEQYIRTKVPNLQKNNGAGHDMRGRHYDNIEVKSSRIPFSGAWTENQLHPDQADAYLFIWYNCDEGTEEICLIPKEKLVTECRLNKQHGEGCFSMGSTVQNRRALSKYMISSFEVLNEVV